MLTSRYGSINNPWLPFASRLLPFCPFPGINAPSSAIQERTMADHPSTVVVVTHDGMGSATAPLQHRLLKNYLTLLLENEMLPEAICFYGEGVRMVIDGSPVLEELQALAEKGVYLIACETRLNYYD